MTVEREGITSFSLPWFYYCILHCCRHALNPIRVADPDSFLRPEYATTKFGNYREIQPRICATFILHFFLLNSVIMQDSLNLLSRVYKQSAPKIFL